MSFGGNSLAKFYWAKILGIDESCVTISGAVSQNNSVTLEVHLKDSIAHTENLSFRTSAVLLNEIAAGFNALCSA
jgi:hypothetical protein